MTPTAGSVATASHGYRPDIDGLRAVAIAPVVVFHAFPSLLGGGFIGVDVFFVISGYLISLIIISELSRGRFSFAHFYARRIRRIFPSLVVVLAACLAWGWFALFATDYARLGKHAAAGAGFVANFALWDEAGYFDSASDMKPLLHLWSLGIEEQFYLLWPALLTIALVRRLAPLIILAAVFVASFLFNVVVVRSDEIAAFYSPATRLWELVMGAGLAYLAWHGLPGWTRAIWATMSHRERGLRNAAAIGGLALIGGSAAWFSAETSFPGWRAGFPTMGALLVISAGPTAWVNRHVLGSRPMVWVGLVSYPLYLWHWPLLSFARLEQSAEPSVALRLGLVAASTALAWLTYEVVEKPIRFRRRGPAAVAWLCALMTIVGLAGFAIFRFGGFIDRPINRSDVAHFLQYYDQMKSHGLRDAYRAECDFMDWDTESTKQAIDPDCTRAGTRGTVLLWGDSYAQALSVGIRSVLLDGMRLAQVTTSGCPPRWFEPDPQVLGGRCTTANTFARSTIAALKPEVLVLAQILGHDATDWEALATNAHALGAKRVVLVGPSPQWLPSLPLVVTKHYWGTPFERVAQGANPEVFALDRTLAARLGTSKALQYLSLVDALCTTQGCLGRVPGDALELMAIDIGHLSPDGSRFVAEHVLRPVLGRDVTRWRSRLR
jgi:peptidoglycan/LPS O-acetylase OafA/YrhL